MQDAAGKMGQRSTFMTIGVFFAVSSVFCAIAGAAYMWNLEGNFTEFCNQAVKAQFRQSKKKEELRLRKEKEEVIARRERAHRRWTKVIRNASAELIHSSNDRHDQPPRVMRGMFNSSIEVTQDDADFWSFLPLSYAGPPEVGNTTWCRNPIDRFILHQLEMAGLKPNPDAGLRVLGRRIYFDLIGLPPTANQIEVLATDESPVAYNNLVTELLSHPGFGERWARPWLDLARYTDSNGYEEDEVRPNAFPYRDFVIWAMNEDLPYDRFIQWQIAGDELRPDFPLAVAATGFLTAGPMNTFMPQESERYDELDGIVSTIGDAMLGMSTGCARCHDHPYDPIPTRDYYGLVAVFAETSRHQSLLVADGGREYRRYSDPVDERKAEIKKIQRRKSKETNIRELDYFTEEERNVLRLPLDPNNKEQIRLLSMCERCLLIKDHHFHDGIVPLEKDEKRFNELMTEIKQLELKLPPKPTVGLTLTGSKISTIHVLDRGDLRRKTEEVGPGFVTVVTQGRPIWDEETWKSWADSGGNPRPRSALAIWMTDIENGPGELVARVIVNRLWQFHFGNGLVDTPSDFGSFGETPSHPSLLEWLAKELVKSGWSLKHIHRLIVTSATYRQGSLQTAENRRLDPDNQLFGRRVSQRLQAGMIRDSLLTAGGNLNFEMHGAGVKLPIPIEAIFNTQEEPDATWPSDIDSDRPELWRRTIYAMQRQTIPIPMLQLHDAPGGGFSCETRKVTTVPTQALALWNSPMVRRQANRMARCVNSRVLKSRSKTVWLRKLVDRVFLTTLSRHPDEYESNAAVSFLRQAGGANSSKVLLDNLRDLCHVMFMSNEFVYID